MNPRLEGPVAEDWGNRCWMQEQPQTPPCLPRSVPNWNDWRQSVTHTTSTLLQAPTFLITKKSVLWTISLPLGWTGSTWQLSLGSSNALSGWNSGVGQIRVAGCRVHLPWFETTGTIPVSSSQLGTILHISTGKKKARKCQRASTTANQL